MCNLSEGVWERGIRQGMERGMQQGMEKGRMEGRSEGRAEGLSAAIRGLMKSMKLSAEQAMAALEIPEEDRPKFRELLDRP